MLEKDDDSSSGKSFQTETENPNNISSDSIESHLVLNRLAKKKSMNNAQQIDGGSWKQPFLYDVVTNNKKVKNNKLVFFNFEWPQKQFLQQELIFYAFLQVLDKNSPKIISSSIQTNCGKDLVNIHTDNNFSKHYSVYLALCLLLTEHTDDILKDTTIKNNFIILNEYAKQYPYNNFIKKYNEYLKNYCNCYLRANNKNQLFNKFSQKLINELNNILYDDKNYDFTKEEKEKIWDFYTQLFFLVLFLNKTDIKNENILLSDDGKITHIDPSTIFHDNNYRPLYKDGFFTDIARHFEVLNKDFVLNSFKTIVNKSNPFFKKYLNQYTLDEKKIKAIIIQATENLYRGEKIKNDNIDYISNIIQSYLQKFDNHITKMLNLLKNNVAFLGDSNQQIENLNTVLKNNQSQIKKFLKKNNIKDIVNSTLMRQQKEEKKFKKQEEEENKIKESKESEKNSDNTNKEVDVNESEKKYSSSSSYKPIKIKTAPNSSKYCFCCCPKQNDDTKNEVVFYNTDKRSSIIRNKYKKITSNNTIKDSLNKNLNKK